MSLKDAKICQVMLPVEDFDRGVAFYRDTLDIPFLFSAPPQMAFFQSGSVRLLVGTLADVAKPQRGSVVYFQVADIHAVYQTLLSRSVNFVQAPHIVHRAPGIEIWLAELTDPDGNQLALMSEVVI